MTRIYVDAELRIGCELSLPAEAAHHVKSVLRLARDDELVVFDGRGTEYEARLVAVGREDVRVLLVAPLARVSESPLAVTLVQSISRGERMDYTIQKAVELGVRRIVPIVSQRTMVRLSGEREDKRLAHWRGIVRHAAEQSGRTCLPEVAAVDTLPGWLATRAETVAYLLQPEAVRSLASEPAPAGAVALLAGPEGGFDQDEVLRLIGSGVAAVRLGPRILRTETAALVALTIMQAHWGDLA